ncbi:helix-hairpin-helix domain-containing protein [Fundidesulfovibrio agrisoli]|uniref:helix-hairpin-helix domain-containing protein n=1 Tax=Fundidesulfovibrio agrisoli TaxID=2922717 RepID=UPI001FAC7EF6|nr:helix-hairpin-helix domain-containing protein [Fundidesulfovibrio agrisoli]
MDKHTEKLLRTIPGIGPAMARDLYSLGVRAPEDLAGRDPQQLYDQLREMSGGKLDRCVLYVFREAVYYASTPPEGRDPEKLKWWNWKG